MVPRLVVKVRRTMRLMVGHERPVPEGARNRQNWQAMLSRIDEETLAAERRLSEAERALNRLSSPPAQS
jgi:hypothetical protein